MRLPLSRGLSAQRDPTHVYSGTGIEISMNATRILALLGLATVALVVTACMPVATTDVNPTAVPSPFADSASSTPVATDTPPTVVTAPPIEPTSSISVTTTAVAPTGAAVPAAAEIDCMGACHEVDINELLGAGAKPQPPGHQEYTTCLACHTTLVKPALPATHVGRLDPACIECHLAK